MRYPSRLAAVLFALGATTACGSTIISVQADSGPIITADVPTLDAGQPVDLGTPIDAGQPVDLGTPIVDLGRPDTRVPRCGDAIVDPMESCDDGNNRSGDGCRSGCLSSETCGNRIEGRACAMDPRMADGFSAAFQVGSTWINLRGVSGVSVDATSDVGRVS